MDTFHLWGYTNKLMYSMVLTRCQEIKFSVFENNSIMRQAYSKN